MLLDVRLKLLKTRVVVSLPVTVSVFRGRKRVGRTS